MYKECSSSKATSILQSGIFPLQYDVELWEKFRPLYSKVCIIMIASKYINILSDSLLLFE